MRDEWFSLQPRRYDWQLSLDRLRHTCLRRVSPVKSIGERHLVTRTASEIRERVEQVKSVITLSVSIVDFTNAIDLQSANQVFSIFSPYLFKKSFDMSLVNLSKSWFGAVLFPLWLFLISRLIAFDRQVQLRSVQSKEAGNDYFWSRWSVHVQIVSMKVWDMLGVSRLFSFSPALTERCQIPWLTCRRCVRSERIFLDRFIDKSSGRTKHTYTHGVCWTCSRHNDIWF